MKLFIPAESCGHCSRREILHNPDKSQTSMPDILHDLEMTSNSVLETSITNTQQIPPDN